MTFLHGKSAGIAFGGSDLSSYLRTADPSAEAATEDVTTFGATSRAYILGHTDGNLSLGGFYDGAEGAIDAVISAALGVEDSGHVLIRLARSTADGPGTRVIFAGGQSAGYNLSSPTESVVAVSIEVQASGGLSFGAALNAGAAKAFATTAAATTVDRDSVDGLASTAVGAVAQFHVVNNTLDGDAVLSVEHSSDDSTFATLTSSTFATGVAGARRGLVAKGVTIDRYVRLSIDTTAASTGTIELEVGFARLPA
jgi:hypothetical protein